MVIKTIFKKPKLQWVEPKTYHRNRFNNLSVWTKLKVSVLQSFFVSLVFLAFFLVVYFSPRMKTRSLSECFLVIFLIFLFIVFVNYLGMRFQKIKVKVYMDTIVIKDNWGPKFIDFNDFNAYCCRTTCEYSIDYTVFCLMSLDKKVLFESILPNEFDKFKLNQILKQNNKVELNT